ncbi:DUF1681-domain-containing protein [Sodiomyces alkalinus F11]|uniref:DUF1681-domain-containing protein n=1 Tax=Sodiomyces alkalinus (strain CBS 110278 / VKM F-3762 / F11) TaxID=1314773 RepID=A0A3N2Q4V2_SODAK|nr:DUF1681-domain-containing protein [Sodiomyces alkalinus F11]ROT41800.1 DUF1681-domain-containing protein [Sodiomyces alkalinus F11]
MEPTIDPATGQSLPGDAIQRVLFVGSTVHVYNIPPLTSTKGHTAAQWTADGNQRLIFTARLRIFETAWEDESAADPKDRERLKVDIILEDPASGQLFAAAPYVSPAVVEPVIDSSRFFALRVQDPAGRKAFLGIGFEERSDAFDFGVAVQEARKSLGMEDASVAGVPSRGGGGAKDQNQLAATTPSKEEPKRDYSLKEGETITVNLGGRFGRRRPPPAQQSDTPSDNQDVSSFSLPPPPSSAQNFNTTGTNPLLPPPPPSGASAVRSQQRDRKRLSAQDLGFDDGQFNEFA